jgi:hypothetical protein
MIAKVAEAQGLRRLWPDEFSGIVVDDELSFAKDVTPEDQPAQPPAARTAQPSTPIDNGEETRQKPRDYKAELWSRLSADAGSANAAKDVLKTLTGKLFISNVSQTEAKDALGRYEEQFAGAPELEFTSSEQK